MSEDTNEIRRMYIVSAAMILLGGFVIFGSGGIIEHVKKSAKTAALEFDAVIAGSPLHQMCSAKDCRSLPWLRLTRHEKI